MKSSLLLLLTSFIWGMAFAVAVVGMDYLGPWTFIGLRFLIGTIVLIPIIIFRKTKPKKSDIPGGILCGLALGSAAIVQQLGLIESSAGKAGFITALYIVMVPILGIFAKKLPGIKVTIAVILAVIGLYLLCNTTGIVFSPGDAKLLCCALLFSFQILLIAHYSKKTDPILLSCMQFAVTGLLNMVGSFIFETFTWSDVISCARPLLYTGILSSGVAYTLQVVAQRDLDATIASLIMSMESVFSAVGGYFLLNETLSLRELCGCVIMFFSIILSQLPDKNPLARSKQKTTT